MATFVASTMSSSAWDVILLLRRHPWKSIRPSIGPESRHTTGSRRTSFRVGFFEEEMDMSHTPPYVPPLPMGMHYLMLKCRQCSTPKRLVVPAYPLKIGTLLTPEGFGQDASCPRCGAALLEVQNEPQEPGPPPPPQGWAQKK